MLSNQLSRFIQFKKLKKNIIGRNIPIYKMQKIMFKSFIKNYKCVQILYANNKCLSQLKYVPVSCMEQKTGIRHYWYRPEVNLNKIPLYERTTMNTFNSCYKTNLTASSTVEDYKKILDKHMTNFEDHNAHLIDQLTTVCLKTNNEKLIKEYFVMIAPDIEYCMFIQTIEMCMEIVKQNPRNFKHCRIQDPELVMFAVKQCGNNLGYVMPEHYTYEVCLAAVKNDGEMLREVDDKYITLEMITEAVKQNGDAIQYIYKWFGKSHKINEELSNDAINNLYKIAIMKNSHAFIYIKNPSPEIIKLAVKLHPENLHYVAEKDQTMDICENAIINSDKKWIIQYVKNPTEDICIKAIRHNPKSFQYIKNKTNKIILEGLHKNINNIHFVSKSELDAITNKDVDDWKKANNISQSDVKKIMDRVHSHNPHEIPHVFFY